jgi:hypothetical protein
MSYGLKGSGANLCENLNRQLLPNLFKHHDDASFYGVCHRRFHDILANGLFSTVSYLML